MPSVSVGMIVFNGLSINPLGMLEASIGQFLDYDEVKKIVICEGATRARNHYFDGDTTSMTQDGKSNDGTRDFLSDLARKHKKIEVILSEGFWDGKTRMCNAYLSRMITDYCWHVDADEFYHQDDIPKIFNLLDTESPRRVDFFARHFYGDWNNYVGNESEWGNGIPWMRLFRIVPGVSSWIKHEPPIMRYCHDEAIERSGKIATREQLDFLGIHLYHYSQVVRSQVVFKETFFRHGSYTQPWDAWQLDHSKPTFRGSFTKEFKGEHPACIKKVIELNTPK